MKGTRPFPRTHSTPPLQRRMSVAPAGLPRFPDLLVAGLYWGRLAPAGHHDFHADRQRERIPFLEAVTS